MTGGWKDRGPADRALVEAAFVALETSAAVSRGLAGDQPARTLSPSALWAHVTGVAPIPRADLAAALLAAPALRETLAGLLERAALAVGPRVAAAATGGGVTERGGDGFRLRLLPAGGGADQTWIVIALEQPEAAPTTLAVLPPDGPPEVAGLEAPVDGGAQLLVETASALVRALADPASRVFLL